MDVVDEDQQAAPLGRRAQARTGQARRLVGSRGTAPAHDHRLEGLDGLRAALLLDHEVFARETRHRPLVLVENGHVEAHQVDGRAEDRQRLGDLRRGLPAAGGSREQESERAEGADRGDPVPHADSRPEAARRVNEAIGRCIRSALGTGPQYWRLARLQPRPAAPARSPGPQPRPAPSQ